MFGVIKALRDSGVSIIIITHKLEEIRNIADRGYTFLGGGRVSGEREVAGVTKEELATLMVGRSVVLSVEREEHKAKSDPIFHAENLQVLDDRNLPAVKGLSLGVRPGEIVGIAGIDGNGQSQLADAIMGLRHVESGVIRYNAEDITHISTWKRINKGIGYVPADRQRFGLVLPFTVAENIAMGYHDRKPNSSCTILDYAAINTKAADLVQQFDIRTPSELAPAGNLSGGNQQKVILAREFSRNPQFLLINQPTRGLDCWCY